MLDLCLLGTSGMMPLPGRWLTSLMCKYNGKGVLIDCGEGTQIAIRQKGWSFHDIDVICITHYHGDHVSGLAGLLLSMGNAERTEKVTIIGPKGLGKVVASLLVIAPELPFELELVEITENRQMFKICGYEITAFRVQHNVTCYGYHINIRRGGRFFAEKARENNIPLDYWKVLQKGETVEADGITYTPDMVVGPERKGIKVTYCTDTRPVKAIAEIGKDSDLMILEGMYGDETDQKKAAEHKHMTFPEAAELAKEANAKELWLTHYSPALTRPKDFVKAAKTIFPQTRCGEDGMSITLDFDKDE